MVAPIFAVCQEERMRMLGMVIFDGLLMEISFYARLPIYLVG
jgi:hypothetical protein